MNVAAAAKKGTGIHEPRLTIIIPAFNEALRLPPTLDLVLEFLASSQRWLTAEVLIVDDGSSDGTSAAAISAPSPEGVSVSVVRHEVNRGKGAAVRTGFAASRGAAVLLSDADLSAPIDQLDVLAEGWDGRAVVIGSRAVDRSLIAVRQPWYRDAMGRTFNFLVRLLAVGGVGDTQCGFKLFPGTVARSLAAAQRLDGFSYDVELLLLARRWRVPVREVGVVWRHVDASRVVPFRHSGQMFRDLVRLFVWRATGRLAPRPASLGD